MALRFLRSTDRSVAAGAREMSRYYSDVLAGLNLVYPIFWPLLPPGPASKLFMRPDSHHREPHSYLSREAQQTSALGRATAALGPADSVMDHVDPGRSRLRVIISSGSLVFEAIVFSAHGDIPPLRLLSCAALAASYLGSWDQRRQKCAHKFGSRQ